MSDLWGLMTPRFVWLWFFAEKEKTIPQVREEATLPYLPSQAASPCTSTLAGRRDDSVLCDGPDDDAQERRLLLVFRARTQADAARHG